MSNINEKFIVRFNPLIIAQEAANEVAERLKTLLLTTGSSGEVVTEPHGQAFQGAWDIFYTGNVRYPQFGGTGNNHSLQLHGTATANNDYSDDALRAICAIRDEQLRIAYRNAVRSVSNDIARLNVDEVNAGDMMDHLKAILEAFPNTN